MILTLNRDLEVSKVRARKMISPKSVKADLPVKLNKKRIIYDMTKEIDS